MIILLKSKFQSTFKTTFTVVLMLMSVCVYANLVPKVLNAVAVQQKSTVDGFVFDDDGQPLPGATIVLKDDSDKVVAATTSDLEGYYSIEMPAGGVSKSFVIEFASLGFASQEFIVDEGKLAEIAKGDFTIDVKMKQSPAEIDEVVVVGYGKQKRSAVSSAISKVKGEPIATNMGATTSFDRGLSGLVKGVQVIQGSGQPGSGVDINIRGVTSPFEGSDNNPLFVIDGVPMQVNPAVTFSGDVSWNKPANPLETINPNDIESLSVLKDAAATAIYGSRGANGVIIVNTKKGKKAQKATITFRSNATYAQPINKPTFLNAAEYKERAARILKNSGAYALKTPYYSSRNITGFSYMADFKGARGKEEFDKLKDDWFGDADTNWVEEVYRKWAATQQYYLNINGGSKSTVYGFNLGHTNQEGLLNKDIYKLYSFRVNLDSDITSSIKTGFSANVSYSHNKTGYGNPGGNNALTSMVLPARPDIAPRDKDGNFNRLPGRLYGVYETKAVNPLAITTGYDFNTKTWSLITSAYAELKLTKNLKLRGDVNISRYSRGTNDFSPSTIVDADTPRFGRTPDPKNSTLGVMNTVTRNINANLLLTYNKTFAASHNISLMAGYSMDRQNNDRDRHFYRGFPDDETLVNQSAATETVIKAQASLRSGLNSMFGRFTYGYKQKYSLTLNFRTDESSKFGPNNKRGYFPSASASWNIAKESFLENQSFLNKLNLRGGYGRTGSNNARDFAYIQFWQIAARTDGWYEGAPAVGLNGALPNLDIKWELSDEMNVGLDFAFLNNHIRGSIDYYNKKTTGALMGGFYPIESGASSYTGNFADLTNKGYEADLEVDLLRGKSLLWTVGFNIASNKNTLDKFNEEAVPSFQRRYYQVGKEVNIITGYVAEGFFENQQEIDDLNAKAPDKVYQERTTSPGDYKYKDLNGDGEITTDDQEYLGSAQADFFGGASTSISYKGLRLSANFSYSVGAEATVFADSSGGLNHDPSQNVQKRYLDTWTPNNKNAKYPREIYNLRGRNRRALRSSALVYDASYIRLQSVQLSYGLPKSLIKKAGINDLTVSVTGVNLMTWTEFPGVDPTSVGGFAALRGTTTRSPYPIAKSWIVGLNINF